MEGKTLVFLKPCDTYSYKQLLMEHRVDREKSYIIGVGCSGKLDVNKMQREGIRGIKAVEEAGDVLPLSKPYTVKKSVPAAGCFWSGVMYARERSIRFTTNGSANRKRRGTETGFEQVRQIEAMTPEERFAFFKGELSKCIPVQCPAGMYVRPAAAANAYLTAASLTAARRPNADSFEEQMFHIIRAFHVAGRCTDCGECSRVCPQGFPCTCSIGN